MSRIEEALEKAARMRNSDRSGVTSEPLAVSEPAPVRHVYSPPKHCQQLKTDNPLIVTANDPQASVAEEYRKLKSLVVRLTKAGSFQNTLMVTSSVASEGKSLTAINLAISLAQEFDHTVLLVDADLRKPSIHRYLGFEPKAGLSDCLLDGTDIGQALVKTNIGKLSILPHGRKVDNPGELFSSSKMKHLLGEIKKRYPDRYVVIDTPPVLLFAETRSISSLVDGIIFVVKEGITSIGEVNDSLAALSGSNLLGLVYNDAATACLSNYYHAYYQRDETRW